MSQSWVMEDVQVMWDHTWIQCKLFLQEFAVGIISIPLKSDLKQFNCLQYDSYEIDWKLNREMKHTVQVIHAGICYSTKFKFQSGSLFNGVHGNRKVTCRFIAGRLYRIKLSSFNLEVYLRVYMATEKWPLDSCRKCNERWKEKEDKRHIPERDSSR